MITPVPFFRRAGTARCLVSHVKNRFPTQFNTYVEPFVGGGHMFFGTRPPTAIIGDSNERLIRAYVAIRDDVESVIRSLTISYQNTLRCFMRARQQSKEIDSETDAYVAAWFLFLTRTSCGGIYKVNQDNVFDVPFAHRVGATLCDQSNLRQCSAALQGVKIVHADFEETMLSAKKGDFIFADPPRCTGYSFAEREKHTYDEQRLHRAILELGKREVKVLACNSGVPRVLEMYSGSSFHIENITVVGRSLDADGCSEPWFNQVLISNYPTEQSQESTAGKLAPTGS